MRLTAFVLASTLALAACTPAADPDPQYDSAAEQIADPSGTTGRSATPPPANVPPLIVRDSGEDSIKIVTYRETGCKFMIAYNTEAVAIEKLGCPVAPPAADNETETPILAAE